MRKMIQYYMNMLRIICFMVHVKVVKITKQKNVSKDFQNNLYKKLKPLKMGIHYIEEDHQKMVVILLKKAKLHLIIVWLYLITLGY